MKVSEQQLLYMWNVLRDVTLQDEYNDFVIGGMTQATRKKLIQDIGDQQDKEPYER